uniref:Transglutaminase-like domain-containing protein n=1 Tax=Anabas testudineus TaxID=64144 RepID=A0A3Q1J638_ANATE
MTTSQYLNILTVTWGPTSPPELDQENVRCVYFIIFNLFVLTSVDMCLQINKSNHITSAYNNQNLVVRRGLEFIMKVTFNRPLTQGDDFQVEFLIGSDPSPITDTLLVVTFGSRPGGPWSGRIVETLGQTLTLGITPTPNAIVGKFRVYVATVQPGGLQRTQRNQTTDLYLLFNAWNKDDAVFYPDEVGRKEYVLNDHGLIRQGSFDSMTERSWDYGQFERGILDACIYILDASKMPIADRGDIIKMVRMGSAMINAQDDNGVVVGNWSGNFSGGKAPASWTGSTAILLQYASTQTPVCYGQCWVFAGVFNTFMRCLGIPARVITNFNSAHDNNGSIVTNLVFYPDGSLSTADSKDSIWNFHCWNEAYMTRADLPPGLGGWQVVDSTPQETSGGYYRCGPASVAAIKQGLLCHPFDLNFCFAEVNSVVISWTINRYKTLTETSVDKNMVGKGLFTKAMGNTTFDNIMSTYKYPKGYTHTHTATTSKHQHLILKDLQLTKNPVQLGQDVNLVVNFTNQSEVPTTVKAVLSGIVIFYTGVPAAPFKNEDFTVTVPAKQTQSVPFKIAAQQYMANRGSLLNLSFTVGGQSDGQTVNATKVVSLQPPKLTVMVGKVNQMFVTVSFTNPLNFTLQNVTVSMSGSGLIDPKTRSYSVIAPLTTITWKESFVPRLDGLRNITATLDCSSLRGVLTRLLLFF